MGCSPSSGETLAVASSCLRGKGSSNDVALASLEGRRSAQGRIEEEVTKWTRTRSAAEIMSVLINNEIAAHSVQSSAECLADTQLTHRHNFIWTEHPDRQCLVENTRFSLSRSEVGPKARAPFLGEHTFEVLSDFLAYAANQIADLAALEVLE